jgi:hypothetical protein
LQNAGEFSAGNYFPMDKSVDRVHVFVDWSGVLGPPWADASVDRGHGGALTGAWPLAALVRQSSPAGAQNGEGSEGNSARVSPELGRRCGGKATVVQNGEAAALGERKARAWREAKRGWERCSELWGWCSPFIGGWGSAGEGWSGVNSRRGEGEVWGNFRPGSTSMEKGVDLIGRARLTERRGRGGRLGKA